MQGLWKRLPPCPLLAVNIQPMVVHLHCSHCIHNTMSIVSEMCTQVCVCMCTCACGCVCGWVFVFMFYLHLCTCATVMADVVVINV